MKRVKNLAASLSLICALGVVASARAGDPVTDAQNKLLARRAAEADCYRKLAETVNGVKLNSSTYVRDFVTESDEIRTAVDTFVKGIRLGPPRYYDDGMCEVDGEVTVAKLITTLKELHTQHYKGNTVTTTDFQNIKKTLKKDVIRVTGAGAPRSSIPDLPEGFEDVLTPLPDGYVIKRSLPAIWDSVPARAKLMAVRGARVDALRRLLEQIKGLRLNSNTLVRDFVTEYDEIATQSRGLINGAQEAGTYYHQDDLIVEVTMEVPVERVMTKIKELHTQHYKGSRITTTDIVNTKKTIKREMIRATGSAVPPPRFMTAAKSTGVSMPDWIAKRIETTGQGTDPDMQTAQGKLRAARAAELDAKRRLVEQVYGLSISSTTTVRDFVTEHDEIATQVEAMLAGAVAGRTAFEGNIATVKVSLSATNVWSVVHQHMLILERRG